MATARNGDCEIFYETFGDQGDPPLLLVNGLGSQCINYHEDWIAMFVAAGVFVVRFDNRDVGLSTSYAGAPIGPAGNAYTLTDMAADAIAVLDAEGIERSHVMGVSMGGMIVQTLAVEHPQRLLSMTSIMSHTGEPGYGGSTPEAMARLTAPPSTDRESHVQRHIEGLRVWGSPEYADESRWRRDAERAFDRSFRPDGVGRQFVAIGASPPRADALRSVRVPTLVVHGDRDTLIDQSGGRRTAELIPGARFELIEGMGHDYPPQLWPRLTQLIAEFVHANAEPFASR
ncbi:MAG: alpha/beta fold hydrolase [Ilumatobacteraceae bacterium]